MNRRILWGIVIVAVLGVLLRYIVPKEPGTSYGSRELSSNSGMVKKSSGGMVVYERQSANSGNETQSSDKTFIIDFGSRDMVVDGENSTNVDKNGENVYMILVDANGRLVVNDKTRLAIERMHALCTPDELKEKLSVLPPDAQREVINLVDYYDKYTKDVAQSFASRERPGTIDEALSGLQELHNQRVMYFGNEVARAMFEKEEAANREMLELVYREKAPVLSAVE